MIHACLENSHCVLQPLQVHNQTSHWAILISHAQHKSSNKELEVYSKDTMY
jgi:hypothetical protein